jgi:hemolysin activation/secretion protein
VTVDDGIEASIELHTPSFFSKRSKHTFYLLGFVDYGWGRNHILQPDEKNGINLLGAGAGARWQVSTIINARLDYAFPLIDPPYSPKRKQHLFFGIVLSY